MGLKIDLTAVKREERRRSEAIGDNKTEESSKQIWSRLRGDAQYLNNYIIKKKSLY